MRIGAKIALSYFLIVILSVMFSSLLFWQLMRRSAEGRVSEASAQTLSAIRINVDLMLENANNYSKMVLSDANLQSLLRQGNIYSNLTKQSRVSGYLYSLIQAVPVVDSVFVFDEAGNVYSVGKIAPPAVLVGSIGEAPWYDEVLRRKGANIFRLNAGGALGGMPEEQNYVSLIRLIRDLDNTHPLGTLIINVPESAIVDAYADVLEDTEGAAVFILDADQAPLVTEQDAELKYAAAIQQATALMESEQIVDGHFTWREGLSEYLVSYLREPRYGLQYISVMPYTSLVRDNASTLAIALVILALNGLVFFASSIMLSRQITVPIRQVLRAIGHSGKTAPKKLDVHSRSVEFQQLFDGYNMLIENIDRLVTNVIDEQTAYRKAELHALQVQIKPHFLYNTLDTVLSLNLSGQIEKACQLVEALGAYYRTSVSRGGEVITLRQEIEMVRNYMTIQNIRYRDLFTVRFDLDEDCLEQPVLKMIIQPLVENALYHGIRPTGKPGNIDIAVRSQADHITINIKDDGTGITPERLAQLLHPAKAAEMDSFGLWGTLERIRIFYSVEDCYHIESEIGKGTIITLLLPREGQNASERVIGR